MKNLKTLSPTAIGFLFALGSAALFAIRPIFVKLVYAQGVDPTTLIAYRMLFSMPVYITLLWFFLRNKTRRAKLNVNNVIAISGAGLLGYYVSSFLDLVGLQYVTAQLGRMILYVYPTFVVLLGAAFFNKKINLSTIMALGLTYTGVAIIFGHDLKEFGSDIILGGAYILACAFTFSLYLLFSKPLISDVGSQVFTCIALIAASIGILIHYSITHSTSNPEINSTGLWLILAIALFCTVIPTFFTTAAVERIGADRTGIIAMVGPAFTSLFAVSVLSESFTIYHLLGIVVTITGVATLNRK